MGDISRYLARAVGLVLVFALGGGTIAAVLLSVGALRPGMAAVLCAVVAMVTLFGLCATVAATKRGASIFTSGGAK